MREGRCLLGDSSDGRCCEGENNVVSEESGS